MGAASAFELTRPYVELAINNDDSVTQREVVGIKVGAETINGAIRMGRDYLNVGYPDEVGASAAPFTNIEHGDVCNPGATIGAGVVGCHSGLNSISGYLDGIEISAGLKAGLWYTIFGLGDNYYEEVDGCIGRINYGSCTNSSTPFFVSAGGTRMNELFVHGANLNLDNVLINGVELVGYGGLRLNTRQIHYLLTPNSPGFYLSFQRQPVSWPRYSKEAPIRRYDAYIDNSGCGGAFEPGCDGSAFGNNYYNLPDDRNACNPLYGQVTPSCGSGYAAKANTGWWLSAANTKMLELRPSEVIMVNGSENPMTIGQLLDALNPDNSNFVIDNPRLDFVAAQNCYGVARFC